MASSNGSVRPLIQSPCSVENEVEVAGEVEGEVDDSPLLRINFNHHSVTDSIAQSSSGRGGRGGHEGRGGGRVGGRGGGRRGGAR